MTRHDDQWLERALRAGEPHLDDDGFTPRVLAALPTSLPGIARIITLVIDEEAMAKLARDGYDPAFGARPLKRAIQRLLHFCQQHMTDDNLFIPPSFAWHWVDWAPLNKQPFRCRSTGCCC